MGPTSLYRLTPKAEHTCTDCPLRTSGLVTQQVPTEVWGKEVNVLFVAEAPGASEDRVGSESLTIAWISRRPLFFFTIVQWDT
jgi:hypothetical protein